MNVRADFAREKCRSRSSARTRSQHFLQPYAVGICDEIKSTAPLSEITTLAQVSVCSSEYFLPWRFAVPQHVITLLVLCGTSPRRLLQ